jgi:multiple sugar transport system ATP-binding protein
MSGVQIRNLTKYFGDIEVIKNVNLDIEDGEFVVLVGPSGCGKSTLLRIIAGLESTSEGDISIGTRTVTNVAPKDRDIAMVFQNYALYPHMTVAENMGFALIMKGMAKDAVSERVQSAALILDLANLLHRFPKELSGGQRQRVAMGRAIVRDPKVFLFDEPLSNLDAKLRVAMRSEIKALHQRLKTTTIYVTHDQVEAMTMADKIVVMNKGVVEQIGAPLDLYDNPINTFVAGFIGSPAINLIRGEVFENTFVSSKGSKIQLPGGPHGPRRVSDHSSVTIGVRPEHFVLSQEGTPAKVSLIEPMGSETQVIVHTERGDELTCLFRERVAFASGEVVRLAATPHAIQYFDGNTGLRFQ